MFIFLAAYGTRDIDGMDGSVNFIGIDLGFNALVDFVRPSQPRLRDRDAETERPLNFTGRTNGID